jgi:hypothetical protein
MGEAMTGNPALADLQFLAGAWDMELSEASFLPDPDAQVHGSVTFEWIEQGAALVMRMGDTAAQIDGRWQKSADGGTTWEHDFTVRYRRPGPP